MLIVGNLPIGISTLISSIESSNDFRTQWMNSLDGVATQKQNHITTWMNERKGDMAIIAETDRLKSNGQILDNASKPANEKATARTLVEDTLSNYIETYGVYDGIWILGENGSITAYCMKDGIALGLEIGLDLSERNYYQLCYSNRANSTYRYLGNFIKNIDGDPMLTVAHSLYSDEQNTNFMGVVVGMISLDDLNILMHESSGLGESGETYLVYRIRKRTRNGPKRKRTY